MSAGQPSQGGHAESDGMARSSARAALRMHEHLLRVPPSPLPVHTGASAPKHNCSDVPEKEDVQT